MPATRASTRRAEAAGSSLSSKAENSSPRAGSKRKGDDKSSPKGKRGRKAAKQQTLKESMLVPEKKEDQPADIEMKEAATEGEGTAKPVNDEGDKEATNGTKNAVEEVESKPDEKQEETKAGGETVNGATPAKETKSAEQGAIEKSEDRGEQMPSNVLEKGIIYFFTRGRVGVEEPESIQDLQRTYIVLRPIPKDVKIGEGAIQDADAARLIVLPKKVFPKSGRDRFMAFVEKAGASMKNLKDDFFRGSEYDTKTTGTRHTPPVTPIGEGVYALTMTGRTSHLAYMLTVPREPGEVQQDMGIREKGSFVTSLKNPTAPGPAYASLPQGAEYPEKLLEEFGGRRFTPINKTEYLDYSNAQLLLIGTSPEKFGDALETTSKDEHHHKETPQEELEKLEDEDQIRVEHLKGDDSVFADLRISKKEYPDVTTTW